ncbi:MAG: GAF domain-containing protein [Chloroflexi bacterium]|nr:GAF domain-containing protein [Chloroflexota bacterium]
MKDTAIPLHEHILFMRWFTPILVFLAAAIHQVLSDALIGRLSFDWPILIEMTVFGITGTIVAWIVLTWIGKAVERQEKTEADLRGAYIELEKSETNLRRAYTELEKTHRDLLSVHDIGKQIASAADIQEILELAAQAPVKLTNAVGSSYISFDHARNRLKLDMTWGLSETYVKALQDQVEIGIEGARCHGCAPLQAKVKSDCPLFHGLQAVAEREGIGSLVCLPIDREQGREGVLTAYLPPEIESASQQLEFLNIVATEIAAALDGVRLKSRQTVSIGSVGQIAQSKQDLDSLMERVLQVAMAGWNAESGAVFLYESKGGAWNLHAKQNLGTDPADPRYGLAVNMAEAVRQNGQPAIVSHFSMADASVNGNGFSSVAAVPLIAEGETVGVLFLGSTRARVFQPRHAPFLSALAHQAAMTVRNAQLHAQLNHMAAMEERYRISREMHDGLAQTLSGLGWRLDHLENLLTKGMIEPLTTGLSDARRMVREMYLDVREGIDGLRLAGTLTGLADALREYSSDFSNQSGIHVEFIWSDNIPPLEPATDLQLLRVVQEALTNTRKHSGARNVWVRVEYNAPYLALVIADDGHGFDPALPRSRHHVGLSSMRERAESLGGTFTLATGKDQGTRITVSLSVIGQT